MRADESATSLNNYEKCMMLLYAEKSDAEKNEDEGSQLF